MSTQPDETYLARALEDPRYAWTRTRRVRARRCATVSWWLRRDPRPLGVLGDVSPRTG